jgi:ABC-type glutathione transport system ATPase component
MGLLESIRRLFGKAGEAMNQADYAALDATHHVEDRLDEATGGRYYDAVEKADEEAGELLERLHLDREPGEGVVPQDDVRAGEAPRN